MSSSGSSHAEEQEEETLMFRCKRCPGTRQYTAAEKDVHRQQHREEDEKARAQKRKPGPKTRTSKTRVPSPPATDVTDYTLFEPIEVTPPPPARVKINPPERKQAARGAASASASGSGKGKKKRRIESKKTYDATVRSTKNPGA